MPEDSHRVLASGRIIMLAISHARGIQKAISSLALCSSPSGKANLWCLGSDLSIIRLRPFRWCVGRTQEETAAGDGCQIQTFPKAFQNIPKIRHLEFQRPWSLSTLPESLKRIDFAEKRKLASKRRDSFNLFGRQSPEDIGSSVD